MERERFIDDQESNTGWSEGQASSDFGSTMYTSGDSRSSGSGDLNHDLNDNHGDRINRKRNNKNDDDNNQSDSESGSEDDSESEGDSESSGSESRSDDDSNHGNNGKQHSDLESQGHKSFNMFDGKETFLPPTPLNYVQQQEDLTENRSDRFQDEHDRIREQHGSSDRRGSAQTGYTGKQSIYSTYSQQDMNRARRKILWLLLALACAVILLAGVAGALLGAVVFKKDDDDNSKSNSNSNNNPDDTSPSDGIPINPTTTSAPSVPTSLPPTTPAVPPTAPKQTPVPTPNPTPPPVQPSTPGAPTPPTPDPTPRITPSPVVLPPFVSDEALYSLVLQNSVDNGSTLNQDNSPQQLAYTWLQDQDELSQVEPGGRTLGADNSKNAPRRRLLSNDRILQRYRLACFFYGTNGPTSWLRKDNWLSPTVSECQWHADQAINCVGDEVVRSLEFVNNRLSGVLVPELGQLTELRVLKIDHVAAANNGIAGLTGGIPTTFGLLVNLDQVKIVGHAFTEPLPDDLFAAWTSATNINLKENNLPGPLPSSIAALTTVTQLHLGFNRFTGGLTSAISSLVNCRNLILSDNQLGGPIASNLFEPMTELQMLKLDQNGFTGALFDVSFLTKLKAALDVSNNDFSGPLPESFQFLDTLEELNLANNDFTGPLPQTFSGLTSIKRLEVAGNAGLTGTLNPQCTLITSSNGFASADCVATNCNAQIHLCCSCCDCGN